MKKLISKASKTHIITNTLKGPKSTLSGIGLLGLEAFDIYSTGRAMDWQNIVLAGTLIGVVGPK